MSKRFSISFVALVYLVIGIVIAVSRDYLTISVLKVIGSAVLAVVLWWLLLRGVNLHIHWRSAGTPCRTRGNVGRQDGPDWRAPDR